MNRPFLRALAVRLGYGVHKRSSHGVFQAWDWGPKAQGMSNHFTSEAKAWANLEEHVQRESERAERLIRAAQDLIREGSTHASEPLPPGEVRAAVARWATPGAGP